MADIAGHYERTLVADRAAIDEESRTVPASLSTETPVERFFGFEVLEHQTRSVDLERASPSLPLLFNHNPDQVIGSVERVRIEGGKLRGTLRFAKTGRGNEVFELIRDGHLRGISIGYQIIEAQPGGERDGLPVYRVTSWRLYEATVTPVPADNAAGVGRSIKRGNTMETDELNEETEGKTTRSQRRRENRRKQEEEEIFAIGEQFDERDLAEDVWLRNGSVEDLKKAIRDKRNNVSPMGRAHQINGMPPSAAPLQQFGRSYSPARQSLLNAFGGERREAEENAYRAGMWIRGAIYGDERAQRWCRDYNVRAGAEGVFSKGGAAVPSEMSMAIINLAEEYGVARQECEIVPMSTDHVPIPRKTGRPSVAYVGENEQISDDDASWDNVNLVARKLAGLTRISNELAEDAVVDMAAFLASEFGEAFAEAEDDALFNGDGTSSYGGITGIRSKLIDGNHAAGVVDATSGDNTLPEIVKADLDTLMSKLPKYALRGAKWYLSQAANQLALQSIARSAGGSTMVEQGNTIIHHYGGYEIVVAESMPADPTADYDDAVMILFGNLRQAAKFGSRRDIRIQVLEERYADFDQLGIKATERYDIVVHDLGDGSNAGPMVGLVGNS